MLALALFLALVALSVTIIELMPGMSSSEPAKVRSDNQLVLRFGKVPAESVAIPGLHDASPAASEEDSMNRRAQASAAGWYVVQKGDTLSSIAKKHLGSAANATDLIRLNRLSDPDDLQPGDRIRLR
jgi:LysM repeat protein